MKQINYKSDFDFTFGLYNKAGELMPIPDIDFSGIVYTTSVENGYHFLRMGKKFMNCNIVDNKLHIICDNHKLDPGEVKLLLDFKIPNDLYLDYIKNIVEPYTLGIKLINGSGDCPTTTDEQLIAPYVYVSAYELAKKAGYQGSLEEYTDFINRLPDAIKSAEDVGDFVSEWAKGKRKIIDALAKWDMAADVTDSFEDLSEKILQLPVRGENEEGFLPPSHNNVNLDLLNILNNHRRMDYPYCWGVQLMAENQLTYQLRNADAYLTSDGHFYEEDTDHVFELDDSVYYWIIFYYKDPTYTVTNTFYNQLYTCCLNGKPTFQFNDTTLRAGVIESYTDDKYVLTDGAIISNAYLSKVNLSGIEELNTVGNSYFVSSSANVEEINLPDLKICNKYIANNCASLRSIILPNLKEITGYGIINSCANLQYISLPNLEVIRTGYIAYYNSSANSSLKNVYLPKLKEIYGSCRLFYYCYGITNITLPSLELVSGTTNNGLFVYLTNLTEINFPALKIWDGTKPLFEASVSTSRITINMPSLFSTNSGNNSYLNLIYSSSTSVVGEDITINLGKPDGGYIYLWRNTSSTYYNNFSSRLKTINIEKGFRSYLRVDAFTELTKECLESIIENLADNTEYDTLQIVFGATNLAKISDEYKLLATNKNYTLS